MDIKLYIEYENKDLSFDLNDNFYDSNNYIKTLEDTYNQTKDVIYDNMSNGFQKQTAYFSSFSNNKKIDNDDEENKCYASCEAKLLTDELGDETYNNLWNYYVNNDSYVNIFDINFDTSEEEFETEFKMWHLTHNKINTINQNNEWKFEHEPKRNLKIEFTAKNGLNCSALLENCKIIDFINNKGYIILIENIKFIKK